MVVTLEHGKIQQIFERLLFYCHLSHSWSVVILKNNNFSCFMINISINQNWFKVMAHLDKFGTSNHTVCYAEGSMVCLSLMKRSEAVAGVFLIITLGGANHSQKQSS
jgi:hypothetical protein